MKNAIQPIFNHLLTIYQQVLIYFKTFQFYSLRTLKSALVCNHRIMLNWPYIAALVGVYRTWSMPFKLRINTPFISIHQEKRQESTNFLLQPLKSVNYE